MQNRRRAKLLASMNSFARRLASVASSAAAAASVLASKQHGASSTSTLAPSARDLNEVAVVGGHGGILGDGAHVYKPLQKGARGAAEAAFYKLLFQEHDRREPPAIFLPDFQGVLFMPTDESEEGNSGTNKQHLGKGFIVLEDVTRPFLRPSIMDIKVGVQAWDEDASPAKIKQERDKYPTQQVVGFRFTGMRVWDDVHAAYKEHGRAFGYALDERTLHHAFYEYLHDGKRVRTEVIPPLLDRLGAIRSWFETQSRYRFYGSSLLFVYEGHSEASTTPAEHAAMPPPRVDVRMIDFAHVWPIPPHQQPHGRDTGYLLGLDSIMRYLRHVHDEHAPPERRLRAAQGAPGATKEAQTVAMAAD